jgi:hypothetical protein
MLDWLMAVPSLSSSAKPVLFLSSCRLHLALLGAMACAAKMLSVVWLLHRLLTAACYSCSFECLVSKAAVWQPCFAPWLLLLVQPKLLVLLLLQAVDPAWLACSSWCSTVRVLGMLLLPD